MKRCFSVVKSSILSQIPCSRKRAIMRVQVLARATESKKFNGLNKARRQSSFIAENWLMLSWTTGDNSHSIVDAWVGIITSENYNTKKISSKNLVVRVEMMLTRQWLDCNWCSGQDRPDIYTPGDDLPDRLTSGRGMFSRTDHTPGHACHLRVYWPGGGWVILCLVLLPAIVYSDWVIWGHIRHF